MPQRSAHGDDITPLTPERLEELTAGLDPEVYRITQRAGTEAPFCGTLLDNHQDGTYDCVICDLPLFASRHKFDSGSGWPSFFQAVDPEHITQHQDESHGMSRSEIRCARCGSHLGHVFPDGPPPAGERHCLNSVSLRFREG